VDGVRIYIINYVYYNILGHNTQYIIFLR